MAGKKDLERLRRRRRRKQRIIRATVHLFVWLGMAVLYYVGFSVFFDTPFEYQMKHSTDRLRREYEALSARYDSLSTVLGNLSERDRNVFRILFESEPYDFDSEHEQRQSSTYEKIVGCSTRQLKRELRERVSEMERQLETLNASYLELQARIDTAGRRCDNIPSIQPVINKQLTLLTSLLRHAYPPLLQDAAIASGRRLHHPRGFARLRHGRRRGARRGAAQLDAGPDRSHRPRQRLRNPRIQPPLERINVRKRPDRCGGATSSPSRATRAFRWPPTSTTKCGCDGMRVDPIHYFLHGSSTPTEYQRLMRIAQTGMQSFD